MQVTRNLSYVYHGGLQLDQTPGTIHSAVCRLEKKVEGCAAPMFPPSGVWSFFA